MQFVRSARRSLPARVALTSISAIVSLAEPARADTSGTNATHDPSRIVESDGKFYFCSTGGSCAASLDGLAWTSTGLHLDVPAWSTTYMPAGNQGVWAPDIVFFNAKYYIYYSFCGVPASNAPCAIGLYTTPTLDSKSASFALEDAGMVVNNPTNTTDYQFSTIDPGPVIDAGGELWVSWGSGYGKDQTKTQIWVTRVEATGLPVTSDSAYMPPKVLGHALEAGRKEGSYLHYRSGYYYLFYNEGSCCSGTASDYTIWVARSTSVSGPFSGDKVFYAGDGNIHGPGHMGIYSACGVERFTYHYYPTATSILGENELSWGADGWPVAGSPSTTPLTSCASSGSGGGAGAGGSSGASGDSGASARGGKGGTGGVASAAGRSGASGSSGAGARGGSSGTNGSGGTGGASSVGAAGGSLASGGALAAAGRAAGGSGASSAGTAGGGLDSGIAGDGGVSAGGVGVASGGQGTSARAGAGGSEAASSAPGSNTDSGCGCSLPREKGATVPWLLVAAAATGARLRRRRRARTA